MKTLVWMVLILAAIMPSLTAFADEFDDKVYNDPKVSARLERIAIPLAAAAKKEHPKYKGELKFRVYDDPELNAFALMDGRIFVHKGLMEACTDDEVAGVLAHEITHAVEGHGKKQGKKAGILRIGSLLLGRALGLKVDAANTASQVVTGLSVGHRSRKDEQRADRGAVKLCYLAGRDPRAPAKVMKKLRAKYGNGPADTPVIGWFVSHPDTDGRIKAINAEAAKYALSDGHKSDEHREASIGRVGTPLPFIGAIGVIVEDKASGGWGFFSGNSTEAVKDELEAALEKTKRFTILNREGREEAWQEQDLDDTGRMDRTTVPSKARTVGARFFLRVTLNYYEVTKEGRTRIGGFGKNADVEVQKAVIKGKVKLESVEQSVFAYTGDFLGSEVGYVADASYGGWRSGADVSFSSRPAGQAVEEACRRAVEELINYFDSHRAQFTAATGKLRLLTEDGGAIAINVTSGKYIEIGDYIVFYRGDQEIAKYRAEEIRGSSVVVRTIKEEIRPQAEKFKIF